MRSSGPGADRGATRTQGLSRPLSTLSGTVHSDVPVRSCTHFCPHGAHSPSRVHPHSCPQPIVDDASQGSTVSLLAEIALTCIDASRIRARGCMPPPSDTDCSPWRTISYSCTHRAIHKIAHTVYKRCGRSLSY